MDCLISQVDLYPTICDLLHVKKPDWLQGNSFLPILLGEKDTIRDEIFAEVNYHLAYEPMRCIGTERYKMIKYFDQYDCNIACNTDDGYSKKFLACNGFFNEKREKEMLFDLYFDPVERINVVSNNNYREVYEELSDQLNTWMEETNDPLLNGTVPKPNGAVVKEASC